MKSWKTILNKHKKYVLTAIGLLKLARKLRHYNGIFEVTTDKDLPDIVTICARICNGNIDFKFYPLDDDAEGYEDIITIEYFYTFHYTYDVMDSLDENFHVHFKEKDGDKIMIWAETSTDQYTIAFVVTVIPVIDLETKYNKAFTITFTYYG